MNENKMKEVSKTLNVKLEEVFLPKPILDDVEKKYLSSIIKPFRNRVKYISKYHIISDTKEYIDIELDNDGCLLPVFKENTMYKGMKVGKEYTLEELGL